MTGMDGGDRRLQRAALVVTLLSSFLTPMALSTVNVALSSIGLEFDADPVSLGWIATSFIIAASVFLIPLGKLADMYGRRRIFLAGNFIFMVASLFLGFSSSHAMLIALRGVQGFGAAMIFGTAIAILSSVYETGQRGKALGLSVAAVYCGLSVGPFVGGVLTHHFGWRSIFFLNVPVGLIIIALTQWWLKGEWKGEGHGPFDVSGSILYVISLCLVMVGFSRLPSRDGLAMLGLSVPALLFFVRWEMGRKEPVLDMKLFSGSKVFLLSNTAALVSYAVTFAVGFLLSFYLQHIRGLNAQETGIILVAQPAVQAVFSPFAGKASDRVEPRIVASSGMALTAAGLFLLAQISSVTPISFIVVSLAILGLGFALFSSPNTNAIMSSVSSAFYGIASSMVATMRLLGQMFSMGTAMIIFSCVTGGQAPDGTFLSGLLSGIRLALQVFAVLCCAGIFASLARGNLRRR